MLKQILVQSSRKVNFFFLKKENDVIEIIKANTVNSPSKSIVFKLTWFCELDLVTKPVMETELCENCKRQVPTDNYQMHTVHCNRNIQPCPLCGEAVSIKEEKEHFDEYHAEIDCFECGQKITRIEEANHLEAKCGKRMIPCQYCEISLPREKMAGHEEYCGSRTKLCGQCSCFVLIKDFQNHAKSCDGGSNSVLPCEFCGEMMPCNQLDAHQILCMIEIQGSQDNVPLLVEGDDGLFHEFGARTPKTAENYIETQTGSANRHCSLTPSDETSGVTQRDVTIVALPCEICGELCASDRLMQHQEECGKETESDLNEEFSTFERQAPDEFHFRFGNHQPGEAGRAFDQFLTERSMHGMLRNLFQQSLFGNPEERM